MKANMIVLTVVMVMLGLAGLGAFYAISYRRNLRTDLEAARVTIRKTNPEPEPRRRDPTPRPKRNQGKTNENKNARPKQSNQKNKQDGTWGDNQRRGQGNADNWNHGGWQPNDAMNNSGSGWDSNDSSNANTTTPESSEPRQEWSADNTDAASGQSSGGWSLEASNATAQKQEAPASSSGEPPTPSSGW